ncbi:hypothetical protein BRC91_04560 [Halobacteriales archaeon QS_4_62_28]|nr:MAG: hypothetical protein BRC91_04560 [Halobacteriales archaeon QS_4_62_28]
MTSTETREVTTQQPEAAIEITDVSLREDTITVGEHIEVEISFSNTGDVDGTTTVSLEVDGEAVDTEQYEIPAGEERQRTLASSERSRAGTVSVTLDDRTVGDVVIEAPDVLHVAPDGVNDGTGTRDDPLSSIQAAIEKVGPGQTVSVQSGEYFEYVEFKTAGESDAPITLTGPPDAVLKPPKEIDHQVISVGASHVHITGLTITGLYDPDEPENPESYHPGKLIDLNTFAEHGDDYVEGLVVSPHRLGGAGQSLINSQMIRDSEIGGFEVIGPAGTEWIFDDVPGHNGEILYLGTAPNNRIKKGFDGYDRTRNIRVHHIDNSDGHPHSELVDIKAGVENVTIEYCTDGGSAQSNDSYFSRSITVDGHRCTIRWNVIRDAAGFGVRIGPQSFMSSFDDEGQLVAESVLDTKPQTEFERRFGKEHAIYGNVFAGNSHDAIGFYREGRRPGRDSNPRPEDQRVLCGNLFDGYSDDAPGKSCHSDISSGDGVGHLGGDSPWNGDTPTKEDVFSRYAMAKHLDVTVAASNVPTNTDIAATITLTNEGDSHEEVVLRFRVREHVLTTETVSVPVGETREAQLTEGGLPNPEEVSITRNGQKVGFVRVTDDG